MADHHGMAGRLLHHVLEALREEGIGGAPNNQHLKNLLGATNANQVTALRAGSPGGKHDWLRRVEAALPQVFKAVVEANKASIPSEHFGKIEEVRDRLMRYFFRRDDPEGLPQFFAHERRYSSNPHSYQELCDEIAWFTRQPDVGWFRTELTLLLGQQCFPPLDPRARIVPAIVNAIRGGVVVTFVVPAASVVARAFVSDFRRAHADACQPPAAFSVRSSEEGDGLPRHEAAVPWPNCLFLRSFHREDDRSGSNIKQVVYTLRHSTIEHPLREHELVAVAASEAELEDFVRWHDAFPARTVQSEAPVM